MARRIVPVAVIVVALLGALWFDSTSFTVTRTVAFSSRTIGGEHPIEVRQMNVRCATEDHYVTDNGSLMFFSESGPVVLPTTWCDGARRDRDRQAVLIAFGGVLLAVLLALGLLAREPRGQRLAVSDSSGVA